MNEALYAEYPEAYDALYADKNYDAEVAFVVSQFEDRRGDSGDDSDEKRAGTDDADEKRALVVGCGTGEHSKRLRDEGFEVVGVDKYEAMVERARTKSDAEFRVGALPDLPVEGEFDLAWLPFTVVQHLPSDQLAESFRAIGDHLADDGVFVFDQIANENTDPRLWTYPTGEGTYARLVQVHEVGESEHHEVGESEHRWDSVVFTPDGECFVDAHLLTDYDPGFLTGVCRALGLSVERHGWYDEDATPGEDGLTVFVAS